MPKKKTSCKILKGFVKEERKSSKDYFNRGFPKQAKEELGHARFFDNIIKKKCKR